jgi:hypothetical protein
VLNLQRPYKSVCHIAASDVHIYLIKIGCATPVDDMEKVLKGDVTLLR